MCKRLEKSARKRGLEINEEKTKYMVLKSDRRQAVGDLLLKSLVDEKTYEFKNVDNFIYLGVCINNKHDESEEINHRIVKGNKSAGSLMKIVKPKTMSRKTKERVYRTVIRPVTLYGCELRKLNKADERKLEVWERKC